MKIKFLYVFSIAVVVLVVAGNCNAQVETILFPATTASARSQTIAIQAGKVCALVSLVQASPGTADTRLDLDGIPIFGPGGSTSLPNGLVFAGPATLTFSTTYGAALTYRLSDNSNVLGQNLPSNAVVIPADAAGPVDIILESSADLVTWTAATPGTYGASTSLRFFRVRAVQN